jgi:hypothetical protein
MLPNWSNLRVPLFLTVLAVSPCTTTAQPSTTGQTGLINMPDARLEPDGNWRFGASWSDPYQPVWSSISLFPRLELSARYTAIRGLSSGLGQGFGDYKDKAFDAKALLWEEQGWWPNLAVGAQDFTGTGVFKANYAVASKHLRDTDYTLGYGTERIDGWFGGMRYRLPWHRNLSMVVEYDANNYSADLRASESGADSRDGGWTYGVEYRKGWFGVQLSAQDETLGANAYISVPFMKPEYVPKLDEPDPYPVKQPEADMGQWLADTDSAARLARALYARDYKNIRLGFNGHTLDVNLTNTRISGIGRAVGRAARVLLSLGPQGMQALRITYTEKDLPLLTYTFTNIHKLRRYFNGMISREQLESYLEITFPDPLAGVALAPGDIDITVEEQDTDGLYTDIQRTDEGHVVSYRFEDTDLSTFQIVPFNLGVFFNDPNGAARFNVFARANYRKQIGRGRFFESSAELTLYEDVSSVEQASNSTLPHVRSDIALYLQGGRFKLPRALVNQYLQPSQRVYARASAGLYELMFAGAGGQVLYLPERGNWAADLSVDWVRQRSPDGVFEFRDYDTVTALGALHYRFPAWGVTATTRVGRFLARDTGVRFELKRRFRSGITFGAWYSRTDGDDVTTPGRPGDPYYDKGIFVSVPLGPMLTRDTRARSELSLAPWTRDVGQMVVSPGDLYTTVERGLGLDDAFRNVGSHMGQ